MPAVVVGDDLMDDSVTRAVEPVAVVVGDGPMCCLVKGVADGAVRLLHAAGASMPLQRGCHGAAGQWRMSL